MFSLAAYLHALLGLKGVAVTAGIIYALMAISTGACPVELPVASVAIKDRRLLVEVAATPTARMCGLSHRASLPEHQGMLFVFPNPRQLSFWMKDTKIPLSIAFLDDKGRILSIQKMVPMQVEERYHSPCPARYALEVNQGWFTKHGIDVGDVVEIQLPKNRGQVFILERNYLLSRMKT